MRMTPLTTIRGRAAPLMKANIDTDVIIRIERLTSLARDALGPFAFEALRYRPDGSDEPDFVINDPTFRNAPFLLAGRNFGCGSSREGAVWALQGIGVRCVIAPSYGDIFYGNCFQNGVLPIRLSLDQVEALAMQCADGAELGVDLELATLTAPDGSSTAFAIDPMRRNALLHGLDDLGLTLKDDPLIREWQARDRVSRPWVWPRAIAT